jgi:hypothetical protein
VRTGLLYVRALEALKLTGVQLELAAMQFAEACEVLAGGSLVEAARIYAKQSSHRWPVETVSEVVAELIKAKESDRMSDVYVKDPRGRLDRFAKAFEAPIGSLTTARIEDFLRALGLSKRSRNNYRRAIGTLVCFAERGSGCTRRPRAWRAGIRPHPDSTADPGH